MATKYIDFTVEEAYSGANQITVEITRVIQDGVYRFHVWYKAADATNWTRHASAFDVSYTIDISPETQYFVKVQTEEISPRVLQPFKEAPEYAVMVRRDSEGNYRGIFQTAVVASGTYATIWNDATKGSGHSLETWNGLAGESVEISDKVYTDEVRPMTANGSIAILNDDGKGMTIGDGDPPTITFDGSIIANVSLDNDTYFLGRNFADDAWIDIIKVDVNDDIQIGGDLGLGTTPDELLHLLDDAATVKIETQSANALGSYLEFRKSRSGGPINDNDVIGNIVFNAVNDAILEQIYGSIVLTGVDASSGTEDAKIEFSVMANGALTEILQLNSGSSIFSTGLILQGATGLSVQGGGATFGSNDFTRGILSIYGDSGSNDSLITMYNSANNDTIEDYWTLQPNGTSFQIGPASDNDVITIGSSGTIISADSILSLSGSISSIGGYIYGGSNDNTSGTLILYGNATTTGGTIYLYNAGGQDIDYEYWRIRPKATQLLIGTDVDPDRAQFILGADSMGFILGTEDNHYGYINLYGNSSATDPYIRMYNSANNDINEDYWTLQPDGDNFYIGPTSDADEFIFSRLGNLTIGGDLTASGGDVNVGVDQITQGTVNIYGDSGTAGGKLILHNSNTEVGSEQFWTFEANGTVAWLGPTSDPNAFIFANDGDLTAAKDIIATGDLFSTDDTFVRGGDLFVGLNDSVDGTLVLYGDDDTQGGSIQLYNGANDAATVNSFALIVDDTSLYLGPNLNVDAFEFQNDGDFIAEGDITAEGGAISAGVDLTTQGILRAYGDDADTGGHLYLYNSKNEDTTVDKWQLIANGTDSWFGPDTNTDAFIFSNAGALTTPKFKITAEGGFAVLLTNDTGATIYHGELVEAGTTSDDACELTSADSNHPIGVVYDTSIAAGADGWIVIGGRCEVLLEDSTAATRGYWVRTSENDGGRADATNAGPGGGTINALESHMCEIGHCLESASAGTDVLAFISMHFN